jgi:hypothetical protein
MKKYRLKNNKNSSEEFLCEKTIVDGFEYYIISEGTPIATNDPGSHLPQIVDNTLYDYDKLGELKIAEAQKAFEIKHGYWLPTYEERDEHHRDYLD